ncbi:MAG: hypothetical protein MR752_04675 [Phocaeicola plebeius]|nr:hypothetical protein [Phocaeicola plebeius]MCI6049807.1 hypothetical protein [Phocaeicola plebeius]
MKRQNQPKTGLIHIIFLYCVVSYECFEYIDSIVVHTVKYIRVGIQCDMDIGVTHPLLQHNRLNAGFNAPGSECMTQGVLTVIWSVM